MLLNGCFALVNAEKTRMSDISFEHVLSSQYTVFDGLAGMHIEDLYQDRQGLSLDRHGRRRRQPV